jgi:tetratricopeptide (TPR) repeat protein
MKNIPIILVSISYLYLSCHTSKNLQPASVNLESVDSRGNLMLLGYSTKERLQQEPFGIWFNKNYNDYKIDSTTAMSLRDKLKDKQFVIFMGTWCGDSRQEVPKIFRLLDYCEVPASKIKLVNLNTYDSVYKQSPGREEKGLNIHRVPDLLVYENEKEIGRVIEKPFVSWEKDLLSIVGGDQYQTNYAVVAYLHTLFQSFPVDKIQKDIIKIADSLKPHITKNEGLQSYGNVLLAAGSSTNALFVLRLNTMLYPTNPNAFVAFGDALLRNGDRLKAKENYEQALHIQPGHEKAIAMLAQLMK